jgi:hypothetical protein
MSNLDEETAEAEYSRMLAERGVSLEPLGIGEVALRRADALGALKIIRAGRRPILGGDVYWLWDGKIELAHANWHTPRDPSSSASAQVEKSCADALAYIARFPEREGSEPLFSLSLPSCR